MGNSEYDELLREYTERITGGTGEANLIDSVPWWLGSKAEVAPLLKALQLEASRYCELPRQLKFSLITPLSNSPPQHLDELILSVRAQSWFGWELILVNDHSERRDRLPLADRWADLDPRIKLITMERRDGRVAAKNAGLDAASGEFVCLLDDDSLIHPCALGILARQLNAEQDLDLIFSHEARIDYGATWIRKFIRKPEFDLFTILRKNYIGRLTAIRRDLLLESRKEGVILRPGYEGVEEHDLMIRLAMTGKVRSRNIPFFLYYGRSATWQSDAISENDPEFRRKTLELIEEYLPQIYPGARWSLLPPSPESGIKYPGIHLRSIAGHENPSLLVIMPFNDHPEITLRCLDSIERQEHNLDIDVVMVSNRTRNPQAKPILEERIQRSRRYRYHIVDHDGAFNYARMNNGVFEQFGRDKDLLLLLNDDTELLSVNCFQTMAMQILADETCGVVGMRLLYPGDRSVQHGGIKVWDNILSIGGLHRIDHSRTAEEYVNEERIVLGVTFAAAMMRRATFERLGTLEEILYPNAYGDVAMCAKAIQAGLRNYYFGTLVGLHYEQKARGRSIEDMEYVAVQELYGQVFSHWMMRNLSYVEYRETVPDDEPDEPPANPVEEAVIEPTEAVIEPTVLHPFRYKVADRFNDTLKAVFGPAHPLVKSGLRRSLRLVRGVRSGVSNQHLLKSKILFRRFRGTHASPGGFHWKSRAARKRPGVVPSESGAPTSES